MIHFIFNTGNVVITLRKWGITILWNIMVITLRKWGQERVCVSAVGGWGAKGEEWPPGTEDVNA